MAIPLLLCTVSVAYTAPYGGGGGRALGYTAPTAVLNQAAIVGDDYFVDGGEYVKRLNELKAMTNTAYALTARREFTFAEFEELYSLLGVRWIGGISGNTREAGSLETDAAIRAGPHLAALYSFARIKA